MIYVKKPETFIDDSITELVRQRARDILFNALEIEIDGFISLSADLEKHYAANTIKKSIFV
ncbi:MAG: hypothetical protein WC836_20970 [Desulfobacula sp.]